MDAAASDDDTLIWAFDRLLDCQALPAFVLVEHVLPCVASVPEELPDATRAKLCLRLMDAELAEGRVDENVLLYLQQLAACDVAPLGVNAALVCPSRDLVLQVKTELGIQTWRERLMSPQEAEGMLNRLFAGQNSAEEYSRYEQLAAALHDPLTAVSLEAEFPFQRLLATLITFVARAQLALPSILKTIQEDVAAGRYEVGRGVMPQPRPPPLVSPLRGARASPRPHAAAVPQPLSPQAKRGRAGQHVAVPPATRAPSPPAAAALPESEALPPLDVAHDEYDLPPSPPRQQQQQQQQAKPGSAARGRQSVLRNLDAGLAELAHQGGRDPLPELLQDAEGAAAAARGGAAPAGRVVQWGEESPAVQHAAPQMRAAHVERHGPLAQPSPGRQSGGRVVGSSAQQPDSAKKRRPRTRWQPEEEAELIRLVKQHGRGNWAAIVAGGQDVFVDRTPVDCKDKWRNLVKHHKITALDLEETEAREAALRGEIRNEKRPGRPPKFLSPKRQRVQAAQLSEDEDEEGTDRDDIDDADEDDDHHDAKELQREEEEGEAAEEEEGSGGEQQEEQKARNKLPAKASPAEHKGKAAKQPTRRSNRLH